MSSGNPALEKDKLQHVILFFLERINNSTLGRTKLMKLLYYVDFDHYEKTGRSVTNAKYRKLPHGPVPDKASDIIDAMVKNKVVKQVKASVGSYTQNRLMTENILFDASKFSGDEMETLLSVAKRWERATADQIATASHREAPWATTLDGQAIDYELANYRNLPSDEEENDMTWLRKSDAFKKIASSLA